jgi:hypothetical protein
VKKKPRLLIEVLDEDWRHWFDRKYLRAWECAALSVCIPPTEDVFQDAQEQTADCLFDHEQFSTYKTRRCAIENAIQARQIPDLQPAKFNETNSVRWIDTPEHVALEPFVSWAIYQKWWLPPELAAIRSACQRRTLEIKLLGIVPNIQSIFSNQDRSEKRPGGCHISLKEAAHHDSVSVRGAWDEYALLLWLKDKGAL